MNGSQDEPPRTEDMHLAAATVAIATAEWAGFEQAVAHLRDSPTPQRRELEETLLQATLFFGFPRVVTAFERASATWPADRPENDGRVPDTERSAAGRELFDAIYAKNAPAVHTMLEDFHPEFHEFVLESAYGRILARPALSPLRRELLATAALAALRQTPQLIAHARGALTFGASRAALRGVLALVLDEVEAEQLMRRV